MVDFIVFAWYDNGCFRVGEDLYPLSRQRHYAGSSVTIYGVCLSAAAFIFLFSHSLRELLHVFCFLRPLFP